MENMNLTKDQNRANKHPEQHETAVQQLQAIRMNRYAKSLDALLKGKKQKQNAPG